MRYLPRLLEATVATALKQFPAVVLTGPRRAGKTSLLRHVAGRADYRLLEDPMCSRGCGVIRGAFAMS